MKHHQRGPRPRYPTDLTDRQWAVPLPFLRSTTPDPRGRGRPCRVDRRRVLDAILYVARSGGAWRLLPHDFPAWQTVYWYFRRWSGDGTLDAIHEMLRRQCRVREGRLPMPTAGVIDSQTVHGAETVSTASRGYDAGKKVNGRKRHLAVDTMGLLLAVSGPAAQTGGIARRLRASSQQLRSTPGGSLQRPCRTATEPNH